jgi:hypothetical protein
MRMMTPVFIRMVQDPQPGDPWHTAPECAVVCTSCVEIIKTNAVLGMPPIFKPGFKWPDAVGLPALLGLGSPFAA